MHVLPRCLVQTAAKFKSEIWLSKDGNEVNGKSMLV